MLFFGALAVAFAEDPPPADPPVSATGTENLQIRYWSTDERLPGFPDRHVLDYVEQVDRFTAQVVAKHGSLTHTVFAQVDEVSLWANRFYLDDVLHTENQLVGAATPNVLGKSAYANPEKLGYTIDWGTGSLTLGDSYASISRGIALDLGRNVDIDVDTSIRGVKADLHPGAWDLVAVVGVLNQQQVSQDNPNAAPRDRLTVGVDSPDVGIQPDADHGTVAASAERYGLGPLNAGLHAVAYDYVATRGWSGLGELGSPDAIVGGGTVELPTAGGLDTFVEGDVFGYPTPLAFGGADPEPGYAIYGSSTAYVGRTTWQLEGKRYKNSTRVNGPVGPVGVAVAPTLEYERVITEDSAATMASNDIWGGRLRVDLGAKKGSDPEAPRAFPYASIAVFRDLDTTGLHFNAVPETIVHPIIGVEALHGASSLLANVGARVDDRDGNTAGADRQLHADIDAKWPLGKGVNADIAVAAEGFGWGNNAIQQRDYAQIESATALQTGEKLTFVWYTDYTSNPLVSTTGNLGQRVYGAAEVQVRANEAWTVKAFYGAYKAGIRCAGGQCRQLPGFEGARVAVNGTF